MPPGGALAEPCCRHRESLFNAGALGLGRDVRTQPAGAVICRHRQRAIGPVRREAEILASLNHPKIAAIHGLERADGQTALVMELVTHPKTGTTAITPRSTRPAYAAAGPFRSLSVYKVNLNEFEQIPSVSRAFEIDKVWRPASLSHLFEPSPPTLARSDLRGTFCVRERRDVLS